MTAAQDLVQILALGELVLDRSLAEVGRATRACTRCRERLSDLNAPRPDSADLPLAAQVSAALRYERWADARRAEINQALAMHQAELLQAQAEARRALGRVEALRRMTAGRR